MTAIVREKYGTDVLELQEVEKPELADDGVLVRVRAASVNRMDWYDVTGTPWIARPMTGLRRPKSRLIGRDFAGTVEAVGKDVTDLQPGDDVFGGKSGGGSFAEYVCARHGVARKPANRTFEEAAAVPVAALTALQGLRDRGQLQPGRTSSSTRLRRCWHVRRADRQGARSGGNRRLQHEERRAGAIPRRRSRDRLHPGGLHPKRPALRRHPGCRGQQVMVAVQARAEPARDARHRRGTEAAAAGAPRSRGQVRLAALAALLGSQKAVFLIANFNGPDLGVLRELLESGDVKPVVEKRYELGEVADALRYMDEGHAQGKIVIDV
jgi:NADPH:quinone reductase-like Zn-dependent oxidoreductase